MRTSAEEIARDLAVTWLSVNRTEWPGDATEIGIILGEIYTAALKRVRSTIAESHPGLFEPKDVEDRSS